MTGALLSAHILAVILTLGPVTVAASMFAPAALAGPGSAGPLPTLHKICRTYAAVAIAVPAFGEAVAARMDVLGQAWLLTAIVLTGLAALVLVGVILPGQRRVLDELTPNRPESSVPPAGHAGPGPTVAERAQHLARQGTARLATATGGFNLLWAAVVVLMVVRPGTSTGD